MVRTRHWIGRGLALALLVVGADLAHAGGAEYVLPTNGDNVVGSVTTTIAEHEDTLLDIGRRFGVGYEEIIAANPGVDPWLPGAGTEILIPSRFILPDAPREGMEDFSEQDLSAYTKKVFSMFSGEECTVRLRFANHLIGSVLDRFGKDVIVVADGTEYFTVSLNVVTSPKFYAWLFGFGTDVEILSPPSARQEMQEMLARIADTYARSDAQ